MVALYKRAIGIHRSIRIGRIITTSGVAHKYTRSFVLHSVDADTATVDTLRRIDVTLVGETAQTPDAVAYATKDQKRNYYFPHCPGNGVENVRGFNSIIYEDVYPFIDWHFRSAGTAGQTMLLVVRPGGDPDDIIMRFQGHDSLGLDVNGFLRMWIGLRSIVLNEAVAYQVDAQDEIIPLTWTASWNNSQGNGKLKFNFGSYDPNLPLVFRVGAPPFGGPYEETGLCWSTYLGGPGDDYVVDSDQDNTGKYFLSGTTTSDIIDFPPVLGNTFYNGGTAAFTIGFNSLDAMLWKTFVGGNVSVQTNCAGVATRNAGPLASEAVFMAGPTWADNLLTDQPNNEFYQATSQILPFNPVSFIMKMNPQNGARTWLTYFEPLPGPSAGLEIQGIDVAPNGRIFISGVMGGTLPPIDEPTTPSPNSTIYSGDLGAFIAMFNVNDRLWWRTIIPDGSPTLLTDAASVTVDGGKAVVVGHSAYDGLPMTPLTGAYNQSFATGAFTYDMFIYDFDLDGVVHWSTYFGGTSDEYIFSAGGSFWNNVVLPAAIDPTTGDIVVVGFATTGLPLEPGTDWFEGTPTGTLRSFIVRFSGTTRELLWSTYVNPGTTGAMELVSACFDNAGNLYVGGLATNPTLVQVGWPGFWSPPGIVQNSTGGVPGSMGDAILMSWDPDQTLRYRAYFGGASESYLSDRIWTLVQRTTNDNIYFSGFTSKDVAGGPGFLTTYFPLDDGGGVPYFEDLYQGGGQEAFVASLCSEMFTYVSPQPLMGAEIEAVSDDFGQWYLAGLASGEKVIQLFDVAGRLIQSEAVHVGPGQMVPVRTDRLAAGVYVCRTVQGAVRIRVQ